MLPIRSNGSFAMTAGSSITPARSRHSFTNTISGSTDSSRQLFDTFCAEESTRPSHERSLATSFQKRGLHQRFCQKKGWIFDYNIFAFKKWMRTKFGHRKLLLPLGNSHTAECWPILLSLVRLPCRYSLSNSKSLLHKRSRKCESVCFWAYQYRSESQDVT
jgi:hypothetical protein